MEPLSSLGISAMAGFSPYILFAAFLLLGLLLYERTGFRLGGIIVLPLLVIYALLELVSLAVFALAALSTLILGHLIYTRTLVYGRRLFVLFLIVGILCTALAKAFIPLSVGPFALSVLPGLFAYNLHREGNYVKGSSYFMLWLGILLASSSALLWLTSDAGPIPELTQSDLTESLQSLGLSFIQSVPFVSTLIVEISEGVAGLRSAIAPVVQSLDPWMGAAFHSSWETAPGLPEGALISAGGTLAVASPFLQELGGNAE